MPYIFDFGNTLNVLSNIPKHVGEELDEKLEVMTDRTANDMRTSVPVDMGQLRSSIQTNSNFLDKEININAFYAAYVEFGTGRKASEYVASLPDDWKKFANEFRGQREHRPFSEFLSRMEEWVKRKRITNVGQSQENIAYNIARNIIINGITPHPFIYPSVTKNKPKLMNEVNKIHYK